VHNNNWLHAHPQPQQQLARVLLAAQRSLSAVASMLGSSQAADTSSSSAKHAAGLQQRRQRLDDYCLQQNPQYSKNLVQSWIAQGKVLVNDKVCVCVCVRVWWRGPCVPRALAAAPAAVTCTCTQAACCRLHMQPLHHVRTPPQVVTKAGHALPKNAVVRINAEQPKFVCRAGFKLEKALDHFGIDVAGLSALDAGLSTGGFTDCLLQHGARHVSARSCAAVLCPALWER
jgi:23S rRNA (cytidine1920-2'-O)/16S rRNA (cytidine1409-2'-O)-methyltransferase